MNNFELIDDYLANRLQGKDKAAFEGQLSQDPALKSELELQRHIVDGIKQARATELKAMLSKVPVGSAGGQIEFSVLRIAAGVLVAGVVSASVYYYLQPSKFPPIENAAADITQKDKVIPKEDQPEAAVAQPEGAQEETVISPDKDEDKDGIAKTPAGESTPAVKPQIELADPSADLSENEQPRSEIPVLGDKAEISPSQVQVEMDSSNKKYNFHYQFAGNKLMLYGSFNRSLYEVLEINSGNHALFFYYKNNFYLLDESQKEVTKLTPIEDPALLKKLKEYRNR
jgi:hypothetical protein